MLQLDNMYYVLLVFNFKNVGSTITVGMKMSKIILGTLNYIIIDRIKL